MIYDKINNLAIYTDINPNIQKIINFLTTTNIENISEGTHDIDGDNLFLIVQEYQTQPNEGKMYEGHKKYIDIQFVLSGSELMQYASKVGDEEILKSYPEEKDIAKFKVKTQEQYVVVNSGFFAMFFPGDLHIPCLQANNTSSQIKKLVFKLKV